MITYKTHRQKGTILFVCFFFFFSLSSVVFLSPISKSKIISRQDTAHHALILTQSSVILPSYPESTHRLRIQLERPTKFNRLPQACRQSGKMLLSYSRGQVTQTNEAAERGVTTASAKQAPCCGLDTRYGCKQFITAPANKDQMRM